MAKYLPIEQWNRLFAIIKANGGLLKSIVKLGRIDSLKIGCHIGTDKYGNKYYHNPFYFYGRNRWVEYADHVGLDYDGSQIPAEWHGWMHYKTDIIPSEGSRPRYKWMRDHNENLSGTKEQYMPYSTTRPKIQAWDPKSQTQNKC